MSTITIVGRSQIDSPLKLMMTNVNNQQVDVTNNDVSHVQWYKNGVIINGATSLTYTPSSANSDQLAVLTADVTLKGATTSVLSDQRAVDVPVTDTLLWTNTPLARQYDMDTLQTVANLKAGNYTTVGTLVDMQNPQLVTIDANHNGSILRFNSATDSVTEQNVITGQVQEMTYPTGLETPAARLTAGFRVVSTDLDVNHDGQADILSQANNQLFINQSLTTNQLLIINETNSLTANGGYVVKGIGDLDGNGTSDIVLFNASHNSLEALLTNGTTVPSRVSLATLPTGYVVDSIADSTGDGKADIMIRDAVSGNLENYQMRIDQTGLNATLSSVDTGKIGEVTLGTISQDYQIIARPDVNGDGKADILWQNSKSGSVDNGSTYISIMDGSRLVATNLVESDPNWVVKAETTDVTTSKIELTFQQIGTNNTIFADMGGANGTEIVAMQHINYGSDWQIDQADQISSIGLNHVLPSSLFGI